MKIVEIDLSEIIANRVSLSRIILFIIIKGAHTKAISYSL